MLRAAVVGGLLATAQESVCARTMLESETGSYITGFDDQMVHIAAGKGTPESVLIWYRCPTGSTEVPEVTVGEETRSATSVPSSDTDYTGKHQVRGLTPGSEYTYKVTCGSKTSAEGHFRTPPAKDAAAPVRFAWVADIGGQGWGQNDALSVPADGGPIKGGYLFAEAVRRMDPDFVLLQGDIIYADNTIDDQVDLNELFPDNPQALEEIVASVGSDMWKNSNVKNFTAITLDEFRMNWKYNLADAKYRSLLSGYLTMSEWDDHEVTNNWHVGMELDERYTATTVEELVDAAVQALYEYMPIEGPIYRVSHHGKHLDVFLVDLRSYRDDNPDNSNPEGSRLLGEKQEEWLTGALLESSATWKIIAMHAPIGITVSGDGDWDAWAQGDDALLGREVELARVLKKAKQAGVTGIHSITADVHYQAVINYHPDDATFKEFEPFTEFVIGPCHAGAFGPNNQGALDMTFGPSYEFSLGPNTVDWNPGSDASDCETGCKAFNFPPPVLGAFGSVEVDEEGALTVSINALNGDVLYSKFFESPYTAGVSGSYGYGDFV